jgi:hypothetical protein
MTRYQSCMETQKQQYLNWENFRYCFIHCVKTYKHLIILNEKCGERKHRTEKFFIPNMRNQFIHQSDKIRKNQASPRDS